MLLLEFRKSTCMLLLEFKKSRGSGWLNELGSWIT
jgi:hypothetical protein